MNCSQIEEYASLYIDGMLTEEEMINFNKHLENCESCSISVENLRTLVTTVNEMEEIDLPENFTLTLREKLEKEQERINLKSYHKENKKSIPSWKILSGVAAGFMILSMTLTLLEDMSFNQEQIAEMAEMGFGGLRTQIASDSVEKSLGNANNYSSMPKDSVDIVEMEKSSRDMSRQESMAMTSEEGSDTNEEEVAITPSMATENRKIINRGRLYLETKEFDESMDQIHRIVQENGGYYQSSDVQYRLFNKEKPEDSLRTSYLTIRVPREHFDRVFNEFKNLGIVINENTGAEDITLTYRDMENEVLNLEVQEERLREILKKAEKVEDILKIENELSRVRGQINSIKGRLKNYDQLVSLSTIELEITEVKEEEIRIQSVNSGVWSRAKESFVRSINEIIGLGQRSFIKFYGLIPWAIVTVIIFLPGVKLGNRLIKKRRNNIEK